MEFGCVHCDRRDWGWGGSFIDRLPTSMQFTFSPAEDIWRCYFTILQGLLFHIQRAMLILLTERVGAVGVRR